MSVALRHVGRTDVGLWTVADDDSGLYESACCFYRVCRYTDMLVKKGRAKRDARASAASSAESVALVAQGYIGKYLGAPYRSHYFSPAVCARYTNLWGLGLSMVIPGPKRGGCAAGTTLVT